MIAKIKRDFLNILLFAILEYIILVLLLAVFFVAYTVIADWKSAVDFMIKMSNDDFIKIAVWFPLYLAFLNKGRSVSRRYSIDDYRPRRKNRTKKFFKEMSDYFEMYDATKGHW